MEGRGAHSCAAPLLLDGRPAKFGGVSAGALRHVDLDGFGDRVVYPSVPG